MKKRTIGLLVAAAAVVILGAVYVVLLLHPEEEHHEAAGQQTITSMQNAELAKVEVQLAAGEQFAVLFDTKDNSTTYTMTGGSDKATYSETVMSTLLSNAVSLAAEKVVEHCTDLSEYQLDDAAKTDVVTITDGKGNETKLTFGLVNELMEGRYCLIGDDRETVYLMNAEDAEAMTKPQSYYRSLTVLGGYYDMKNDLKKLVVDHLSDGTVFALENRGDGTAETSEEAAADYYIVSPIECRAEGSVLSNGILYDVQYGMTSNGIETDDVSDLAKYGLDNPVRMTFTFANSEETVLIGDYSADKTEIYAMLEGGDTIYRCDASRFTFLDQSWQDYRATELFQADKKDIRSVKIQQNGKTHTVKLTYIPADENKDAEKDAYTGTLDGKDMAESAVSAFYLALTDMDSTDIRSEAASGDVVLTVTVTLTDKSKHVLEFIKGGSREYIASVDGSGFVYTVPYAEVQSLLAAIGA